MRIRIGNFNGLPLYFRPFIKKDDGKITQAYYYIEDQSITLGFSVLASPKLWREFTLWHEYAHYDLQNVSEPFEESEKKEHLMKDEALADFYACCKVKLHFNTYMKIRIILGKYKYKEEDFSEIYEKRYVTSKEDIASLKGGITRYDLVYQFYKDPAEFIKTYKKLFQDYGWGQRANLYEILIESGWDKNEERWKYINYKNQNDNSIEDFVFIPEDAEDFAHRGDIYFEQNKYYAAINDYNEAIKLNPSDARVYGNRGLVYKALKENKKAIADLEKALSVDPDIGWVKEELENLNKLEKIGKAELTQFFKIRIGNFNGLPLYLVPFFKKGKNGRAAATYYNNSIIISLAVFFAPKLWKQYILWHEYAHHAISVFAADETVDKEITDINEAFADFYACCKLKLHFNTYIKFRSNFYKIFKSKVKEDDCCTPYEERFILSKENIESLKHGITTYDFVYQFYRNPKELIRKYKETFKKHGWGENTNIHKLLFESGWDNNEERWKYINFNKQDDKYTENFDFIPEDTWDYIDRGNIYYDKENYDSAINDYTKAIELDPNLYIAYCRRGNAYELQIKYVEAIKDFNETIRLEPNADTAYSQLGYIYLVLDEYDEAIVNCSKAIELNPNVGLYYLSRGMVYRYQKKYKEAIKDISKGLKLETKKEDLSIYYTERGETYRKFGKYRKAIRDFNKSLKIDPTSGWTYGKRGLTYKDMGQKEKATADFQKALSLEPDIGWVKKELYNIKG